jgi:hypothetical protein
MRNLLARALLGVCTLLLCLAAPAAIAQYGGPDSIYVNGTGYVERPDRGRRIQVDRFTVTLKPRLDAAGTRAAARKVKAQHARVSRTIEAAKRAPIVREADAFEGGIVKPLMDALRQVQAACPGFVLISGVRAGAGWQGLHRYGRAIDIGGKGVDYDCAYRALKGFPGGMNWDAWNPRINHIHISWAPGGAEWGTRWPHPEFQGGIRSGPKAAEWKRRYEASLGGGE